MSKQSLIKKRLGWLIVVLGLAVMLFPLVAMLYSDLSESSRFEAYRNRIEDLTPTEVKTYLEQALGYNASLDGSANGAVDPFTMHDFTTHTSVDYPENEAFAYISIPRLQLELPVFLGASNENLAKGLAQIDGTDMPIGGTNTRSVLAGHRGYRTGAFLQDADLLEPGDLIYLIVFDHTLEYKVYDTEVIAPNDIGKLAVQDGKDLLTLLTCTPFAVNTNRLLINAERVPVVIPEEGSVDEKLSTNPDVIAQKLEDAIQTEGLGKNVSSDNVSEQANEIVKVEPHANVRLRRQSLIALTILIIVFLIYALIKFFLSFRNRDM